MSQPLADRIKSIRNAARLTQVGFASRLGVNQAHISKIESGTATPSDQLIKLICNIFDVRENWLRGDDTYTDKPPLTDDDIRGIEEAILSTKLIALTELAVLNSNILSVFTSRIDDCLDQLKNDGIQISRKVPEYNDFDAARKNLFQKLTHLKNRLASIGHYKKSR